MILEEETPLCRGLWQRKLSVAIDKTHWNQIHQLRETRLKSLAWTIIHNIYPTNTLLFKMKIKPSPNCIYCQEEDTMEHFFFRCKRVKMLWVEVQKEIQIYMGTKIAINEKQVLLGAYSRDLPRRKLLQINWAINVAKLAISKYKYGPNRPILDIYFTDSYMRQLWTGYK